MDAELERAVRIRAAYACEYCAMPQSLSATPFQIDHIIARKHGGDSAMGNLALSCLHCNIHKGANIAGLDPAFTRLTRLFNPRTDYWPDHFQWNGPLLCGLTDVGRTTIDVLSINHPEYLALRRSLIDEGVFPAGA